ncbi:MAG: DUF3649 domain-containing protein [Anaerolineae bacterium]|nr:DUF3649 domain-containing protein [Anaerolineae bacterium]
MSRSCWRTASSSKRAWAGMSTLSAVLPSR